MPASGFNFDIQSTTDRFTSKVLPIDFLCSFLRGFGFISLGDAGDFCNSSVPGIEVFSKVTVCRLVPSCLLSVGVLLAVSSRFVSGWNFDFGSRGILIEVPGSFQSIESLLGLSSTFRSDFIVEFPNCKVFKFIFSGRSWLRLSLVKESGS